MGRRRLVLSTGAIAPTTAGAQLIRVGSERGEATDCFDWLPGLRDRMEPVLAGGTRSAVLEACHPNSGIVSRALARAGLAAVAP